MKNTEAIYVVSLGCSKNRVDTEHMLGLFKQHGYELTALPESADILIVNTCGFIEAAKEESIETIFELAQYKARGEGRLLIVTGCLSERYGDALKAEIPEIDCILGVADYPAIFEAIRRARGGERVLLRERAPHFMEHERVLTTPKYSAYVKISDGCDNRCSYCAIPLIRGGYRSRPMQNILNECDRLSRAGARELTLIAQDTSRYGNDFPGGRLLLSELLTKVDQMEAVHWLRVLYCYPDTVTEQLLDVIAGLRSVCNYLDLPLQHINADILRRMNRRGSPESIRRLIQWCDARDILVRTTMIVGFPGETRAQFDELLDFVRQSRFARLGAFTYSPEEDTPAASMPDQVDEDEKLRRLDELMMLQQQISLEINSARVGDTDEVLVEAKEGETYRGRSRSEAPEVDGSILFTTDKELAPGDCVRVKLTRADAYDLYGEAVK